MTPPTLISVIKLNLPGNKLIYECECWEYESHCSISEMLEFEGDGEGGNLESIRDLQVWIFIVKKDLGLMVSVLCM